MYGQSDGSYYGSAYYNSMGNKPGSGYKPQTGTADQSRLGIITGQDGSAPSTGQTPQRSTIEQMLMEYLAEMKKPIDPNDPYVKNYMNAAQNGAEKRSRLSGIEGGLSNLNTEHASMNALGQLEQQRRGMYQGALGMGLQQDRWMQEQYMADQMRQYTSRLNSAQGVGGLLGGVAGGAAGFLISKGDWKATQQGAGMGSQLGAGATGMAAGGPPSWNTGGYRGGL